MGDCDSKMDSSSSNLKRKRSSRSGQSDKSQPLHTKNPYYNTSPDFAALARLYPEIVGDYVKINPTSNKGHIDFTQNDALRALTKALLLKDFGVNVEIPSDHLCPPLPNRLNYLCWISDLLEHSYGPAQTQPPLVLDIGVGPVCIYPILGNKVFGWSFLGSDVDANSVAASQQTIDTNPTLQDHIRIVHVPGSDSLQELISSTVLSKTPDTGEGDIVTPSARPEDLVPLRSSSMGNTPLRGPVCTALHAMGGTHALILSQCEESSGRRGDAFVAGTTSTIAAQPGTAHRLLDVVMTNPPFYDADEQIQASEYTACSGSISEMRTLGGEVVFIAAIIFDSLLLRDRVLWYTAMVGKHSSLRPLRLLLTTSGVPQSHLFVTTLVQGLTHRWALAWTYCPSAAAAYKAFCVQSEAQAAAEGGSGVVVGISYSDNSTSGSSSGVGQASSEVTPVVVLSLTTTVQHSALKCTVIPSDSTVLVTPPYKQHFDNVGINTTSTNTDILCRVVASIEDTNASLSTANSASSTATSNSAVFVHSLTDVQHHADAITLHYRVRCSGAGSTEAFSTQYKIPLVDASTGADTVSIAVGIYGVTGQCEKWRDLAAKFHEIFEANLFRTNRRWRRLLASKTNGT